MICGCYHMKFKNATKDLDLNSNERLFLKCKSPFAPKIYKDLKPKGFKIFTLNSGFKKKGDDLLIIVFEQTVKVACKFSLTSMPSAPIIWDKKNNQGKCKVLIVNSGNANAHTGIKGIINIDTYVNLISNFFKCSIKEILVSSTGVIGEQLDIKNICKEIKNLETKNEKKLIDAARSIWTTDTFVKTAKVNIKIDNQNIMVYGFAKGSGMISPNMGTMLAYIFIDCDISSKKLEKLLQENIQETFNSISVDSDTSTSDTLSIFSVGKEKVDTKNKKNLEKLNAALYKVMHDLSLQVIKDGEGLSKLLKINILKCKSKNQAKNIGFAIANSPLVKTAIAGEDANWGRIIMAIGKSYEKINQNKIEIFFGKNLLCKDGKLNKNLNVIKLNNYMKKNIIDISVIVGNGNVSHTIYGNDLTSDYIRINANYRS